VKGRLKTGDVVGVVNADTVEEAREGLERDWPGCKFNIVIPGIETRYNYIAEVISSEHDEE